MAAEAAPAAQRYRVVGKKGALLRAAASLDSEPCGELANGDVVRVLERETVGSRERWRVEHDAASGWATAKMFEAVDGAPADGAAPSTPPVKKKIEIKKKKRPNRGKALELARAYVDAARRGAAFDVDDAAMSSAWRVVGVPDLALALSRKAGDAEAVAEIEEAIARVDERRGLFFPREASRGDTALSPQRHGIAVADGVLQKPGSEIVLGYRCWRFVPDLSKCADPEVRKIRVPYDVPPLLVYFHGNGEVAPEYDSFAQVYLRLGVRLCVVDFRGYGWSSDAPTKASELLSDMMAVIYGLDDLKTAAGLPRDCKTILFGRSMGSIPAAHLACLAPSCFDGIIVESGVAVSVGAAKGKVLETSEKFGLVPDDVPALVIHGDADTIVPYENGKAFCAARPSARLLTLNAGHNDLLMDPANGQAYFNAVRLLVHAAVSGAELPRDIPHAKGAKPARPSGFGSLA